MRIVSMRAYAAAVFLVFVSGLVWGQGNYPSKPIRFIVPFPPGGATDPVARMVGGELSKSLGQQVVVENRGGGGGTIGVDIGVKSAPDGYTIFLGSTGGIGINPVLMAKPPYDPARDIAAISMLALSLPDPVGLEMAINNITGVVTSGLFARRGADVLLLGTNSGVRTITPS